MGQIQLLSRWISGENALRVKLPTPFIIYLTCAGVLKKFLETFSSNFTCPVGLDEKVYLQKGSVAPTENLLEFFKFLH